MCLSEQYNFSFLPKRPIDQKVILIGALSFVGSRILVHLKSEEKHSVVPVEDINSLVFDEMLWYRYTELVKLNAEPLIIDLGNTKEIESLLKNEKPDTIIFVPTSVYLSNNTMITVGVKHIETLKHFVQLMEMLYDRYKGIQVILPSVTRSHAHIERAMLKQFEVTLTVYNNYHKMPTAIIRARDVYGPWMDLGAAFEAPPTSCWYIDAVANLINTIVGNRDLCFDIELPVCNGRDGSTRQALANSRQAKNSSSLSEARRITMNWYTSFANFKATQEEGVVLTTYITSARNPQFSGTRFVNNKFRFISRFITSCKKFGLRIVIMHDKLDPTFQANVKNYYDKIEFIQIKVKGRTPNDIRFFRFWDYILAHPEYKRVIMSDVRDVTPLTHPFNVMAAVGDYFFVGLDVPFYLSGNSHLYVEKISKSCLGKALTASEPMELHGLYNAGVIGGSHHTILAVMHMLLKHLKKTGRSKNCNMSLLNYVPHRYYFEWTFTGYPFQSAFKIGLPGPFGMAMKHKTTEACLARDCM